MLAGLSQPVFCPASADYAPFDVDVTTKDPGDAALLGIGVRVIIGGDSPDGAGLGGIAWVGSFGTNNPAFVYPRRFYSSVKGTGEAASHEAGHTLGLLHDDNVPNDNAWGPIMVSGCGTYMLMLAPDLALFQAHQQLSRFKLPSANGTH
jgi:hypothetical protein